MVDGNFGDCQLGVYDIKGKVEARNKIAKSCA